MLCAYLRPLEQALAEAGLSETFRGRSWSRNCREWVYFNCVLDRASLCRRFGLPDCVVDHEHWARTTARKLASSVRSATTR